MVTTTYVILGALVLLVLLFLKKSILIIPQSETRIIERLGKYHDTLKPGVNLIIPFIDRAKNIWAMTAGRYHYTYRIDLREQVYDFDKQNVITKDNILMQINALLYFQIVDPFKAVLFPKSNQEFWKKKFSRNKERDAENLKYYQEQCWRVCTVWECAIRGKNSRQKIEHVTDQIIQWLEESSDSTLIIEG